MNERTARRSRLLWSVLAALIVLALVSPVAVAAYRGSAKTAREQTRTWAEERYEDALLIRITGDVTSPPSTPGWSTRSTVGGTRSARLGPNRLWPTWRGRLTAIPLPKSKNTTSKVAGWPTPVGSAATTSS